MTTIENNKYQQGKIYMITNNAYNKKYIGSTTQTLSQRMTVHRCNYKRFNEGKTKSKYMVYDIFDEYGIENCKIELIEKYPCNDVDELEAREGKHIRDNECVNKVILGGPTEDEKELRRLHKIEYNKQRYKNKVDEISIKQKEYYELHKKEINENRKEYNKEYRELNKEVISEKRKQRYLNTGE